MFSGYNIKLDSKFNDYYKDGKKMLDTFKVEVYDGLDKYIKSDNGKIDGSKLQEDWFPFINDIDVFISHSHTDKYLAIGFAGFLKKEFQINSFIDSGIWGYANDLLKKIDNQYCKFENGTSYDYNKRNFSTSHVHMMLSTAINKMIDEVECVMFLNTQNSVLSPSDSINNETASPWIYSEIKATEIIRKKELKNYREKGMVKKAYYNESREQLEIQYKISLDHLIEIAEDTINKWKDLLDKNKFKYNLNYPLDLLYEITIPTFNLTHKDFSPRRLHR